MSRLARKEMFSKLLMASWVVTVFFSYPFEGASVHFFFHCLGAMAYVINTVWLLLIYFCDDGEKMLNSPNHYNGFFMHLLFLWISIPAYIAILIIEDREGANRCRFEKVDKEKVDEVCEKLLGK